MARTKLLTLEKKIETFLKHLENQNELILKLVKHIDKQPL